MFLIYRIKALLSGLIKQMFISFCVMMLILISTLFCDPFFSGVDSFQAKTVFAQMYYYKDKKGVLHFSNIKKSSRYKPYKSRKKTIRRITHPPEKFDTFISEASSRHNVPAPLIKAIIKVESDFNPKAKSHKGARGLMQIISDNYTLLDIDDPYDPWQSINGGTMFFRKMLNRFGGNLNLALAAYNAGPDNVDAYGKKVPPFPETRDYVRKVKRYYNAYRRFDAKE